MEPPSDIHVINARKIPIVPKVAMNGSIFPTVTIRPLSRPQPAPTNRPTTAPTQIALDPNEGSSRFIVRIMMPVTKAIIDPTERSRQREEMTKVAPMAMMAMNAERVITFARLVAVAKLEFTKTPASMTTARAINGPMAAQRMRCGALTIGISVVALLIVFVSRISRCWVMYAGMVYRGAGYGINDVLFCDFASCQFSDDASSPHHQDPIGKPDKFRQL